MALVAQRRAFDAKMVLKGFGSQGLCPMTPVAMAISFWLLTLYPNFNF